jgi:hypothetical protein
MSTEVVVLDTSRDNRAFCKFREVKIIGQSVKLSLIANRKFKMYVRCGTLTPTGLAVKLID